MLTPITRWSAQKAVVKSRTLRIRLLSISEQRNAKLLKLIFNPFYCVRLDRAQPMGFFRHKSTRKSYIAWIETKVKCSNHLNFLISFDFMNKLWFISPLSTRVGIPFALINRRRTGKATGRELYQNYGRIYPQVERFDSDSKVVAEEATIWKRNNDMRSRQRWHRVSK